MTGDDLKALRNAASLTQAQLAHEMGVSLRIVGLWERQGPPAKRVPRLLQILGEFGPPLRKASNDELVSEIRRRLGPGTASAV